MKKLVTAVLVFALAMVMAVTPFAADNGDEYDFEEFNEGDKPTWVGGWTDTVCVLDGKKVLKIDATTAAQTRYDLIVVPADTDYLDPAKKFVYQLDMYFDNFDGNYQILQFIHRPTSSFNNVAHVDGGKLLLGADKTGTIEGYEELETEKWYNFAVVIDITNKSFDFYVNGVKGYTGTMALNGGFTNENFDFRTGSYEATLPGGIIYVDNIKIFSGNAPDSLKDSNVTTEAQTTAAQTSEKATNVDTADTAISAITLAATAVAGVALVLVSNKKRANKSK